MNLVLFCFWIRWNLAFLLDFLSYWRSIQIQGDSLESGNKKRRQQKQSEKWSETLWPERKDLRKQIKFLSWATALSEFVTLFLPLNSPKIQVFCLNLAFKFHFLLNFCQKQGFKNKRVLINKILWRKTKIQIKFKQKCEKFKKFNFLCQKGDWYF